MALTPVAEADGNPILALHAGQMDAIGSKRCFPAFASAT
jgi:hypothetical protein